MNGDADEDGWNLLFARIDLTQVEQLSLIYYGRSGSIDNETLGSSVLRAEQNEPDQQAQQQQQQQGNASPYPRMYSYPYPKAGRPVPRITLHVTKVSATNELVRREQRVRVPDQLQGVDHYLSTRPIWISKGQFLAVWKSRGQDLVLFSRCSAPDAHESKIDQEWQCEKIAQEKQLRATGSLMVGRAPLVVEGGDKFFALLPVSDGHTGTYQHIAQITMSGKKQFLTHGQYVVDEIFGYRRDLQTL